MRLILIDGSPAAGKNTLGELLVKKLLELGKKAILLDLDSYVEQFNQHWIWDSDEQREKDQKNARINLSTGINKYLKEGYDVISIGERFLTTEDLRDFISKIPASRPTYVYHLSSPFILREKRLHSRGTHSLIDLVKDQKDRDTIKEWPGYVYENVNSPEEDAENLTRLIQDGQGLVS